MVRQFLPLSVVLALGCAGVQTPEPTSLAVGQRVRVTTSAVTDQPLTGTVMAIREDALTLRREEAQRIEVALDEVTSMAIYAGRRNLATEGMLVGLGLGLASFVIIDAAEGGGSSQGTGGLTPVNRGSMKAVGFVVLTGGGLMLGTLIGMALRTDHWAKQTLPVNLGLRPQGGGVTFGGSLPVGRFLSRD